MKAALTLILAAGMVTMRVGLILNRPRGDPRPVGVFMLGRDRAVVLALQRTRTSIYLRTERLSLAPVANELAQCLQRGVSVSVDLPLEAALDGDTSGVCRILMGLGAVVSFREGAAVTSRGTYLEMDGERFIYSTLGLVACPSGAAVSYAAGPIIPVSPSPQPSPA